MGAAAGRRSTARGIEGRGIEMPRSWAAPIVLPDGINLAPHGLSVREDGRSCNDPRARHFNASTAADAVRLGRGATFDPTGTYRYALSREWDVALPRLCVVMLNPSTADA